MTAIWSRSRKYLFNMGNISEIPKLNSTAGMLKREKEIGDDLKLCPISLRERSSEEELMQTGIEEERRNISLLQ